MSQPTSSRVLETTHKRCRRQLSGLLHSSEDPKQQLPPYSLPCPAEALPQPGPALIFQHRPHFEYRPGRKKSIQDPTDWIWLKAESSFTDASYRNRDVWNALKNMKAKRGSENKGKKRSWGAHKKTGERDGQEDEKWEAPSVFQSWDQSVWGKMRQDELTVCSCWETVERFNTRESQPFHYKKSCGPTLPGSEVKKMAPPLYKSVSKLYSSINGFMQIWKAQR